MILIIVDEYNQVRQKWSRTCDVWQAALTYAEAQMRIDDSSLNDEVTLGLRSLNKLAKILKQRRQQNGFVSLVLPLPLPLGWATFSAEAINPVSLV